MSRLEITLDSREVATLIEKENKELLRDIRRYVEQIEEVNKKAFEEGKGNERKIALVEFFREFNYVDAKGEARPCYQKGLRICCS